MSIPRPRTPRVVARQEAARQAVVLALPRPMLVVMLFDGAAALGDEAGYGGL
jgi:hypothetical protein